MPNLKTFFLNLVIATIGANAPATITSAIDGNSGIIAPSTTITPLIKGCTWQYWYLPGFWNENL